MKRKNIAIFLLILLFTACQTDSLSPIQRQLANYAIKPSDLPSGWSFQGKDWGVEFGGESYAIIYQLDMYIFITHSIAIYAGEDQAKQAYMEWENDISKLPNMQPDKSLSFSPLDANDDYEYNCGQWAPNDLSRYCVHLQRHNNLISYVKINLDSGNSRNLTVDEINGILRILDQRLNDVQIGMMPSGDSQ